MQSIKGHCNSLTFGISVATNQLNNWVYLYNIQKGSSAYWIFSSYKATCKISVLPILCQLVIFLCLIDRTFLILFSYLMNLMLILLRLNLLLNVSSMQNNFTRS